MKVLGRWAEQGRSMRELREKSDLSQRDVERQTDKIVRKRKDPRFHVSRAYLQDIELGKCMPSSCKIEALALTYEQDNDHELLKLYGVTREEGGKLFTSFPSSSGSNSKPAIDAEEERRVLLAVVGRFPAKETLQLKDAEAAQLIPAHWREFLGGKHVCFAVIGSEDHRMGKVLPAGCLVAVDTNQKTIDEGPWETDADRPIYLVWLPKLYVCCWAYQVGNTVTLVPYQPSPKYETEPWKMSKAFVIGRVIHAWRLPRDETAPKRA
jgi:transcriptional regulator with XRE-family HTH domain